jgi:hypothetical protein
MVKKEGDKKWDEFTGLFKEEECYNLEETENHMKKYFSSKQFEFYKFGIFKRFLRATNVYSFDFVKEVEITEWHNKIILD